MKCKTTIKDWLVIIVTSVLVLVMVVLVMMGAQAIFIDTARQILR
jgi:hypothetical protein